MKKLIAILASVALACTLAFTVTSCQSNEDKAVSLTKDAIKAAKNNDVKAFKKAQEDLEKLIKDLKVDEIKKIGEKLESSFSEEDMELLEEFADNLE